MMSKGSRNRTKDIDKFNENFDAIFKKKQCVSCNKEYPKDYFPTKQKEYKVSRLDICKECYKK